MLWFWLNRRRSCRTLKVDSIISQLERAGVANSQQEALWLAAHALGVSNAEIWARAEFSHDEERRITELVSRRVSGEPLQYILGEADFYGRDFHVGRGVLIPRHDTETLIDGVKKIFAREDKFRFLDWGTGSGCIAVTIMLEFPNAEGCMLDVSNDALSYARCNLERYGLNDRAEFCGDGEFDLIISNPPYIPSGEIDGLMREVRDFEPITALDGGADGMRYYREIIAMAGTRLKRGGYIILETGSLRQVEELENFGGDFESAGRIFDTGNFPRCIILRRGKNET